MTSGTRYGLRKAGDSAQRGLPYETAFFRISTLAALVVAAELVLQSFGSSICLTEGCRIVSRGVRFGERSILLIGLAAFSCLAILSAVRRSRGGAGPSGFITVVLITALACEGFFAGYQAFVIRASCVFCLVIFGVFIVLGVIRLLGGESGVLAGFAACVAVFGMLYLVKPPALELPSPAQAHIVLFSSKDCKHCAEVKKDLEAVNMKTVHFEAAEFADLMKALNIEHVPTLLVNDPQQKLILTGKNAIQQYLSACSRKPASADTVRETGTSGAKRGLKSSPPPGQAQRTVDFLQTGGIFSLPQGTAASDDGLCKQDEVCR